MYVMSAPSPLTSDSTRERVLDAAALCLAEGGFARTNLARIAGRAGLTTGAIQHTFGDKATLLWAVVERGFERMADDVARIPAERLSLEERVAAFVDRLAGAYALPDTRGSLEVLLAMRGDEAFRGRAAAFLGEIRGRIDRMWMGTFWDVDAQRAAHVEAQRWIFNVLNGRAVEALLVPPPASPEAEGDLEGLCGHVIALLRQGGER